MVLVAITAVVAAVAARKVVVAVVAIAVVVTIDRRNHNGHWSHQGHLMVGNVVVYLVLALRKHSKRYYPLIHPILLCAFLFRTFLFDYIHGSLSLLLVLAHDFFPC